VVGALAERIAGMRPLCAAGRFIVQTRKEHHAGPHESSISLLNSLFTFSFKRESKSPAACLSADRLERVKGTETSWSVFIYSL